MLPSSLLQCIHFLDNNLDYSSSHGLYFQHTSYENSLKNGFKLTPLYKGGKSISENKAIDRLKIYLNGESIYYPFYAVHRTKDFKLIWKNTSYNINDWYFSEVVPCCMSLILGKMKILPILYSSREINIVTFSKERYVSFFLDSKVHKATSALSNFLIQKENISLITSQNFFNHYFKKRQRYFINLQKGKRKEKKIIKEFIINSINSINSLKKLLKLIGIKKIYEYLFYFKYIHYRKDLKKLKSTILSSKASDNELNASRLKY